MKIWKDVRGYEGVYQVSNQGEVRSLNHLSANGRKLKGKTLKISCNDAGYQFVCLAFNKVYKTVLLHRLVAEAFIPNPDNLPCINHKDENKKNNKVDNLEWCTYAYNNSYSEVSQKAAEARRGKPLSIEHRKAISNTLKKSQKERTAKRMATMKERYPNGIKQSEESNKLRSLALKGVPKSEETKQKMRKPKSPETIEKMRKAQKEAWKRRKERIGGNV